MKKFLVTLCIILTVMVLITGAFLAISVGMEHFTMVGGHLYPLDAKALDLRERELTIKHYDQLQRRLPNCYILWNVPFQDGTYPSDSTELTINTLSEADIRIAQYFTGLQTVHAEQCKNYPELMKLQQAMPDCKVLYQVEISGFTYDQDAESVKVIDLNAEAAQLLTYLPKLSYVNAVGDRDYAFLAGLLQEHPEWNVTYDVNVAKDTFRYDEERVITANADFEDLRSALVGMPNLKEIIIQDPFASCQELLQLRAAYPNTDIRWHVTINGERYDDDLTELDISAQPIESIAEAKRLASYFPGLTKLIVEKGDITSEEMAEFREEMRPNYKVVWTIVFTPKYSARTDATLFMPTKFGEYYFLDKYSSELKYLEDVIAVDLGHHSVRNLDFLYGMPHIKYLVLAHTQVKDITPIGSLKELLFLELDWTQVTDYEPLLGCTALEDLNLGKTWGDVEPVCQMTWLKNLWWLEKGTADQIKLREALPDTRCNFAGNATVANGWRDLQNYFDMRDALGMYYMPW